MTYEEACEKLGRYHRVAVGEMEGFYRVDWRDLGRDQ